MVATLMQTCTLMLPLIRKGPLSVYSLVNSTGLTMLAVIFNDLYCSVFSDASSESVSEIPDNFSGVMNKGVMYMKEIKLISFQAVSGGTGVSSIIGDDSGRGCTEIGMGLPF